MNIFVLHKDPTIAAYYHHDKHVVKMILESAQMLSTAHHILDSKYKNFVYKKTHYNHPCAIWARHSKDNYIWLYNLLVNLLKQFEIRFNKEHKTKILLKYLKHVPHNINDLGLTKFAQAMPKEYKDIDCVKAYRKYYVNEKLITKNDYINTWREVGIPYWIEITNIKNLINENIKNHLLAIT